jgi:DNA (cytosine-5)-methyltransferase 1
MATFLDLFAGCGGFSSGLVAAGLDAVGEVELDAWAAETLRCNFPQSRLIEADIREVEDATIKSFSGVDVIVGGGHHAKVSQLQEQLSTELKTLAMILWNGSCIGLRF